MGSHVEIFNDSIVHSFGECQINIKCRFFLVLRKKKLIAACLAKRLCFLSYRTYHNVHNGAAWNPHTDRKVESVVCSRGYRHSLYLVGYLPTWRIESLVSFESFLHEIPPMKWRKKSERFDASEGRETTRRPPCYLCSVAMAGGDGEWRGGNPGPRRWQCISLVRGINWDGRRAGMKISIDWSEVSA